MPPCGKRFRSTADPPTQDRSPHLYFVIGANGSLNCQSLGTGTVGEVVVGTGMGCGMMMIDWGGPWPVPSCAAAMVVRVDAVTKRLRIAYFIIILLRA